MTAPVRNHEDLTPFGIYLHEEPELDSRKYRLNIQNVDYVFMQGIDGKCYILLLEEKRFKADTSNPQRYVFQILHQVFQLANNQAIRLLLGFNQKLVYRGYHLVQFENTSPLDGRIWFNRVEIDRPTLNKILRFEIDPASIGKGKAS